MGSLGPKIYSKYNHGLELVKGMGKKMPENDR
jgi:hypothetical protein